MAAADPDPAAGRVLDITLTRIERALKRRERYRYVHPLVRAEGDGWMVLSPNCSRSIDPAGGTIAIAWLRNPAPAEAAGWQLHSRDHARQQWVLREQSLSLPQALTQLCQDPLGIYWP